MAEIESRIVDLEIRFMKLERFAQELSDVVAEQRRTIDALTLETKRLLGRLSEDPREQPTEELPPHY